MEAGYFMRRSSLRSAPLCAGMNRCLSVAISLRSSTTWGRWVCVGKQFAEEGHPPQTPPAGVRLGGKAGEALECCTPAACFPPRLWQRNYYIDIKEMKCTTLHKPSGGFRISVISAGYTVQLSSGDPTPVTAGGFQRMTHRQTYSMTTGGS